MPTFKTRKSFKGLFTKDNLNKALSDNLSKKPSFRGAAKAYGVPIRTLHHYKNLTADHVKVKKSSMVTIQIFSPEEQAVTEKKIRAAIITDSSYLKKKKHFPERFGTNATASRRLFETDSTSEKETPVNADITENETFIDALNDNSPTEQWEIPKPGDFVV